MVSFSEFARSMSHLSFGKDYRKSGKSYRNNPSHLSGRGKDLKPSERVARSIIRTLAAIETAAGERDEGHRNNFENVNIRCNRENFQKTAVGEGKESQNVEDFNTEPKTTVEP